MKSAKLLIVLTYLISRTAFTQQHLPQLYHVNDCFQHLGISSTISGPCYHQTTLINLCAEQLAQKQIRLMTAYYFCS